MPMIWNVKNADTVSQAVSAMRHGSPDCRVSPDVTRIKSLGQTMVERRELREALQELKNLACDEYYKTHGITEYETKCAELFAIKQRNGYVQLVMKG